MLYLCQMKSSSGTRSGCHAERSRSISLFIALCLILFSCGSAEEKKVVIPDVVLSKEKMAEVLTDIHIAEAEANLHPIADTAAVKSGFQKIFEKNKISKEQYEKSLSFYIEHPELLNEVYEKVLNELSRMQ